MAVLLSLFLMAAAVKEDRAPLRAGCTADAEVVATLPGAAPLTIRYALAGGNTPCYKVAAEVDGKTVEGYLPARLIQGLDEFENGRREAAWLDTAQVMGAVRASQGYPSLAAGPGARLVSQAAQLIETSQPGKALRLLEPELQKRRDPVLLALAGVAAWRADEPRRALDYWRSSLEIAPNPDLDRLYSRVEREMKGDQSTEKLYGLRIVLRYDAGTVPAETARQMLAVLDDAFTRVSDELGCNAEERIVAIVQSREAYRKTIDVAEWNGGQYDGRIRIPLFDGQGMDGAMRRALAHETTHACLSMLGRWPAWLQEGLAQKFAGDTIAPAMRQKLAEQARQGKLPKLSGLGQDWSRLDTEHAEVAYALSLAAVELFYQYYRELGIRNLAHHPDQLAPITADLDLRLGL